jgi:hypothetical protein
MPTQAENAEELITNQVAYVEAITMIVDHI